MPLKVGGFDMTDVVPGGGRIPPTHFPFEISTGSEDNGVLYAKVRPGTISGVLPGNIFDKLYLGNGTYYIKLQCQTDGKTPTYVSLFLDSNPAITDTKSAPNTPPPVFSLILGVVIVVDSSSTVLQVEYSNLTLTPRVLFVETKVPTTPGEEPFTRWWGWVTSYE